jgi:hypothetical protein
MAYFTIEVVKPANKEENLFIIHKGRFNLATSSVLFI